jgi:hypothetical protein
LLPHPTLAPEWTIGVAKKIARTYVHSDVVMEGKILAPFECFEAIDRNFIEGGHAFELARLDEQALATESRDVVSDRGRAAEQCPGDLTVAPAAHHEHQDAGDQFRTLLPV